MVDGLVGEGQYLCLLVQPELNHLDFLFWGDTKIMVCGATINEVQTLIERVFNI